MKIEIIQKLREINLVLNDIDDSELISFFDNQLSNNKRSAKKYLECIKSIENFKENFKEFIEFKQNNKLKSCECMYNAKYQSLKHNVSYDEGKKIVNNLKESKATSLNGFILRHGQENGEELFRKFQETSAKGQKTKNSYGEIYLKECSPRCKEYYTKRGYSEDEAIKMVSEFQKHNSGANKWYWLGQGYTKEETDEIISAINKKKSSGKKYYMEKFGKDWEKEWFKRVETFRKTIDALPRELYPERDAYYAKVMHHTNNSILFHSNKIKNLHLRSKEYHLDHIFSIKMGFVMDIPPEIIGHWTNLRIIPMSENCSKGELCHKSYNQLMEDYYESIKENNN